MKKLIGMFAAILLLFSCIAPISIVYASSVSDSIILQLTEQHTENEIDIDVRLITNTGILDMVLELDYNKNIFEYTGYEQGTALVSNFDELISTPLSSERTLPIRFSWLNRTHDNDFSTGLILKLHFTLKEGVRSGDYKISMKCDGKNSYVTYADNGAQGGLMKSAIISKAVVSIYENKITETEIVENTEEQSNLLLIIGIVLASTASVAAIATVVVIKIYRRKRKNKNWVKI